MTETLFDSQERVKSFGKEATKQKFLSEVFNNLVWKAHLKQAMSDTCISKYRKAQVVLLRLLGYQRII